MFAYWFIAHSIHVCNITSIYSNSIFCPWKAFIITYKMSNRIQNSPSARRYFSDHASLICDLRMKTPASKVMTVSYRKLQSIRLIDMFPYTLCKINIADYLVVARDDLFETKGNWGFLENQDWGSLIEDQKKPNKISEICDRPAQLLLLLLFRLIYIARFVSSLSVFAFEGQNTKLSVNVFLTCITHYDARSGFHKNCLQAADSYHGYHISPCTFFSWDIIALPRERCTFL